MPKKTYKIPFCSSRGTLLSYAYEGQPRVEWRDNFVFEDELEYVGFGRGRSAVHMYFKSKTAGATYVMFLVTFDKLLRSPGAGPGRTPVTWSGRWTFEKRGQNYGVKPAE